MDWSDRIGRRVRLRDLHIVLAVAESGSMAKASARLSISHPVVSKAISELEQTLGVSLFDRSSRGVEPTPYGRALLDAAVNVFDEMRQGFKRIEFLADPTSGDLAVGCPEIILAGVLPVITEHFLGQHPRVQLKVPGRYTAPSPEDQRQIEQDKETKAQVFETISRDREWKGSFAAPVNAEISDVFGVERVFNGAVRSTHQGLDFRVPSGTPVAAVNSGRVILARPLFFEGNCVVIDHGQGLLTLYLHLSKFSVKEGDDVSKGQPIGLSGGTGRATGPHLHLAVRWQGVYLNPQVLLKLRLP